MNEYNFISFAQWISNRMFLADWIKLNDDQINRLVENYLEKSVEKWNLRFFLKLFQDYIIRNDNIEINEANDILYAFESYCIDIKSLEYVNPNSLDKKIYLYPLLQNFYNYINNYISNDINYEIKHLAVESYQKQEGICKWFDKVLQKYSKNLQLVFESYLQSSLNYDIEMFFKWVYKAKGKQTDFERNDYSILNFNNRKNRIINEIRSGLIDAYINQRTELNKDRYQYHALIELTKEYDSLDFIGYLNKRINISKQVPKDILESLANDYINQNPNVNKKVIYNLVREARDNQTIYNKICHIFKKKYGNRFSLDRYFSCKYHGVFLFRKKDNLSDFLKKYWYDIHNGTGDAIDFYYTDQDIKRDYHCKEWMTKHTNLDINVKEFPSIFLWELHSNNSGYILLKDLSHEEIFEIIEYLTAQLEDTNFNQSLLLINAKIKQIIADKKIIHNNYIVNNSQIGAFGPNARSNNNIFNTNREKTNDKL